MKSSHLGLCLFASLVGCATAPTLTTVPSVDLNQYSGKWYEIARYPNFFQRRRAAKVIAEYAKNPDGTLTVINVCWRTDGSKETARGVATVIPNTRNSKLKVRFAGPLSGDYWIIGLAHDYSWALVGHPSRRYLWTLARSPQMSDERYEEIIEIARQKGYKPERLHRTAQ